MRLTSGLSIQQRLPVLICVLLLFIIAGFSCMSYLGVKEASLKTGRERLSSLAGQLSAMFQQSTHTVITATHTAANQDAFKRYFQSTEAASVDTARAALQKLLLDTSFQQIELLDANRVSLLHTSKAGISIHVHPVSD